MLERCKRKLNLDYGSTGAGVYALILSVKGVMLLITDFLAIGTMVKDVGIGVCISGGCTLVNNLILTLLIGLINSTFS